MMEGKAQQPSTLGREAGPDRPDVILEVLFDAGMFFLSVHNIGNQPAIGVSVKFSQRIIGPDGKKDISGLPLFSHIEFLGPRREIVAFVDASNSYFQRKQPVRFSALICYSDREGRNYDVTINHDLEIYRDLPYLVLAANRS